MLYSVIEWFKKSHDGKPFLGDPDEAEAAERDDLRRDRHKERERDRRIKRANPGKAEKMRSMEVKKLDSYMSMQCVDLV